MYSGDVKFAVDQAREKLVHTQVVGVMITPDEDAWGLMMVDPKGKEFFVWVDCDPEGNGPGWLAIDDAQQ